MADELASVDQQVTAETIEQLFGNDGEDDGKLREGNYTKAIAYLDRNGDGGLSRNEIVAADWNQLRGFGKEVAFIDPSSTYNFEYSLISYERVYTLLTKVLQKFQKVTRQKWQKVYAKVTQGTVEFANRVFTGLTGSDDIDHVISADVTKEDINRALEKWLYYWQPQYSSSQKRPRAEGNDDEDEKEDDTHKFQERHFDTRDEGGAERERSKKEEL